MFKRRLSDEEVLYMYKLNEILGNPSISGVTRDITKLMPFLYIGGQHNAESLQTLRTHKITYILNCGGTPKQIGSPYQGLGIEYYQFNASDDDNYNISQHFSEAFNFIEKARRKGAKILVHCAMGINRSGAVCAAYLLREKRMSLLETIRVLKLNRLVVLTNIGFRYQLVQFARSLGLLDSLKVIKNEIEHTYARDNLLGDKTLENASTNSYSDQKSWKIPEYVSKYRYREPIERSYRPSDPVGRNIGMGGADPVERTFQPLHIERSVPIYEDKVPRPRIKPSVYRPVEYEDFVPVGVRRPIIDPELLDPRVSYKGSDYNKDSFGSTSADSFRFGRSVNVGRRHSLAPSMTHYDNGRYVDNVRKSLQWQ